MREHELGFIGFGLIGGSIARALKKKQPELKITVYSRRHNPDLEVGKKEGIIDRIIYRIDESLSTCDIIFLCAPVLKNVDFLPVLKDIIKPSCILTDVGSVKGNICDAAVSCGLRSQFIGGHPMAGSEKTGYKNSTDILLENAYYLLTPFADSKEDDIKRMRELVETIGANCVILSPEDHDRITAAISHVPHIIAACLVNMIYKNDNEEENMKRFAAGGFKDITRIASSSPAMWQDICIANGKSISYFLEFFREQLSDFETMIAANDFAGIYNDFEQAGDYRNSIPAQKSSVILQTYELFVNIDDRTGAIADIATILSHSDISIKNIGIIHNREYADGVLRIELYDYETCRQAKQILADNNYIIVERD